MRTIVLAGKVYEVAPLPLGRLKVALPAFGRAGEAFSRGEMSEATFADVALILSAGLGKTVAEVEEIPATLPELAEALAVIAEVSGLTDRGAPGEARPAVVATASAGMTSTAG